MSAKENHSEKTTYSLKKDSLQEVNFKHLNYWKQKQKNLKNIFRSWLRLFLVFSFISLTVFLTVFFMFSFGIFVILASGLLFLIFKISFSKKTIHKRNFWKN